jgi:hypothetical protein
MTAPLLRTDLNDFLFSPIFADENGMHLTMLSALARTGADPWAEAATLAGLPRESATEKLVGLLASLPNGPAPGSDTATLAAKLVGLLHAAPKKVPAMTPTRPSMAPTQDASDTRNRNVRWAVYSVAALIVMLIGNWAVTNWQHRTAPSETSAPISR